MTATAAFDPFGAPRGPVTPTGTLGFTGEQTDPTGLVNLRARMYSPELGRFLTPDTVQPNAKGTQGWGRYTYAANNPTTYTDPSGHLSVTEDSIINSKTTRSAKALRYLGTCIAGVRTGMAITVYIQMGMYFQSRSGHG